MSAPASMNAIDESRIVWIVRRYFDADGYEQGRRINGRMQCPQCGLWWPCEQEPEGWEEDYGGRWHANDWGLGVAECELCQLAMVGGFDTDYVIDLRAL